MAGKAFLFLQSDYIRKQTKTLDTQNHKTQDFEVQFVSQFLS